MRKAIFLALTRVCATCAAYGLMGWLFLGWLLIGDSASYEVMLVTGYEVMVLIARKADIGMMRNCPIVGDRVRIETNWVTGACTSVVTKICPSYRFNKLRPFAEWRAVVKPDSIPTPWPSDGKVSISRLHVVAE